MHLILLQLIILNDKIIILKATIFNTQIKTTTNNSFATPIAY